MWTMTSRDYIKSAIENLEKQLRKGGDISGGRQRRVTGDSDLAAQEESIVPALSDIGIGAS